MRQRTLFSLLAAAAVTMPAAASRPMPDSGEIALFEARGYPVCLAINPLVARGGRVNENAIEECHCALDRLTAERGATGLPPLDEGNARSVLDPYLEQCRGGGGAADKLPVTAKPPIEQPGGADQGGKPIADTADGAEAEPAAAQAGGEATREAPAWLAWTGLPTWALWLFPIAAALAGLVLLLTRRRGGGRGDLTGPPPSMRADPDGGPPGPG